MLRKTAQTSYHIGVLSRRPSHLTVLRQGAQSQPSFGVVLLFDRSADHKSIVT